MKLIVHFLISLPFVVAIAYFTQSWLNAALFIATAFAIDIDHYALYLAEGRGLSPSKARGYYGGFDERYKHGERPGKQLMVFHTAEFAIACTAVSIAFSNYYLLAGLVVHQVTDILGDRFVRRIPNLRRKSILVKRW